MIRFVPFEEVYIPQMAELLAERHQHERKRFPFLPEKYEDPKEAALLLEIETLKPYSAGIVALREEEVIGYLLYEFKQDAAQGRYIFMDYPSVAVKSSERPRLIRLMYAEAGAEWVRNGYFIHVLMAPVANDASILEWLEQSFRFDQRYAVLPIQNRKTFSPGSATVDFKKMTNENSAILQKMAHWNSLHQATAPSWQPITKETLDDVRRSYEELAYNEDMKFWIAEHNGIPAAFHLYEPIDEDHSMTAPVKAAYLLAASTNMELRGKGIGKAIANYCFHEMKESGFDYITADWSTANHLASYFWPELGFQSYMIRMIRTVDSRIAWAHGGQ